MIPILLKNSRIALVDDIDADLVEGVVWTLAEDYLTRNNTENGKRVHVKLHRLVLERKLGRPIREGFVTDHKNRNKCDNRRDNLREATYQENWENSKKSLLGRTGKVHHPSGYKGVVYDQNPRMAKKWRSTLYHGGKAIYLGHYETPEQAAAAYQVAVIKYKVELAPLPPLGKNGFYNPA